MKVIQLAPGVAAYEATEAADRAHNVPLEMLVRLGVRPEVIEVYLRYQETVRARMALKTAAKNV